jgi:molybdopterin-guanine dinucleotide biosynthesis protein A
MGGRPKGLLTIDGETIVARWRRIFVACEVPIVLVGANEAYASMGLPTIEDAGVAGPMGGLDALCAHATNGGATHVVAVACDMPHASEALVRKLLAAPAADAVAPRVDDRWQPFFARYDARATRSRIDELRASGVVMLQKLLDAMRAVELPLTEDEKRELRDWDSPSDVTT